VGAIREHVNLAAGFVGFVAALAVCAGACGLVVQACSPQSQTQAPTGASPSFVQTAPLAPTVPCINLTAKDVVDRLATAGLPISNVASQDASTDPDGEVGTPGGPVDRASFDLPGGNHRSPIRTVRRGGVVHIWAHPVVMNLDGAFDDSVYSYSRGPVAVLITKHVSQDLADRIGSELQSIC
jgi:hypothetical protein